MRRTRISLLLVLGMMAALLPMGAVTPASATTGDLVITGVVDGPLTGGIPKAVEFYVVSNISDLSVYGFGSANNGGGSDGQEFTFPAVSATAGTFIRVASEDVEFNNFFGFAPDYTSSAANINGNDAIELFNSGVVVDVFGDINVDGSGQPWDHLDGWAYRVNDSGQDGSTFVLTNWTFSGINALDGETTNATAAIPFPIGTYTGTAADAAPAVASSVPADGDVAVSVDSSIAITFSEDVVVAGTWFDFACTSSGAVSAAVSGGPAEYTLDPDADFTENESCTVTVLASQVTDVDADDPPNTMAADYEFTFTVEGAAPVDTPAVINEILADPAAGLAGDANGDGTRDFSDDEFVEIVNDSPSPLDMSGWTLSDGAGVRHTFPSGTTVPAMCSIVVFGGETPTGPFGNAVVQTASSGALGLNNSGDSVTLNNGSSDVVSESYGGEGGDNQSLTRDPDVSGAFAKHSVASGSGGALFSPGTLVGGASFSGCQLPAPELVVNEIMQNPAAVGDSDGEWFEVYNAGAAGVDIEGWTIKDGGIDSHVIANGGPLVVSAGGYLVLGGNGDSSANGGVSVDYVYGSDINLANGDDEVILLDTGLNEVDRVEYDGGPVFPNPTGASMALIDPALDNNDGTNWCESGIAFGDGDLGSPGTANDCAAPEPTERYIHEVQGEGFVSPLVGDLVIIEGVVVGDFQEDDDYPNATYDNDIDGYHVQEEDVDVDSNPATSEGIFVRDNDNDIAVGDVVRVTGTVAESFGLTRIQDVTSSEVIVPAKDPTVTAASVTLPFTSALDFESVEGMSVMLPQALVISEYFNFDRFGEIVLTTERAAQPTAVYAPGSPEAAQLAADNAKSRITLDDGRGSQNPDPAIHPNGQIFDLTNLFRGGDTVANVTGVMDYAFGAYKVQPTIAPDYTGGGTYTSINGRPGSPDAVGGDLTVATFNVLNYFTTLDTGAEICGPLANQGCRGADTAEEFTRQKTKIVSAIADIDADVVGLMEIENDAADVAVEDLVDGLNAATAPGTYANIVTGPVGPDAIRVALIYKPASVTPYGAHAVLAGAFLDPNELGDDKNRAALAQSFVDNANGGVFTVAVNHLKSKGSECGAGDDDPEQGSCNVTRTLAAKMLADWLQTDPTSSGDADFLIIGDLNSYDKEDPINALAGRGYTDLVLRDVGEYAYSYVFSGQWGYLDYIMANGAAAAQVTGTTVWHINADEPDILDYDMTFKKPAQQALYEPNAFRSSDHDPVIVGLELTVTPMQAKDHAIGTLSALLPTGSRSNDNRIGKAIESIESSLNPAFWIDDLHLTDEGNKVFDEEKKAVKDLMKVDGSAESEAGSVIDALVEADRELAATAIEDAIAAGGSEKFINKALLEMEEAELDINQGRPDKAIDHYKQAWHFAQKALDSASVRFATFNASLNRFNAGDLATELSAPGSAQPSTIAEIIQRNRPDVVLINEFDYDAGGVAAEGFQDNYLSIPQNGAAPIEYPYRYVAPSNTGVASGYDLDNNGSVGGPNDAFGFGFFEGQYAFAVYSMYPIDVDKIRTFQNFLWRDMPGALLPEYEDGTPWFTDEELDVVRLSSKSHVDIPIRVDSETIHFLVSHPTPPVFDGDEDRNGKRNYDEIRFWADYVSGGNAAKYIYDDAGGKGGLSNGAKFVIAGDQNSDPFDGDSYPGAAQLLLDHPRINDSMTPSSLGGTEQAALQGGINDDHLGDPAFDTADFADWAPGNLRVDYVLPRHDLNIVASGVFWPETTDPLFPLVGTFPFPSSDHRLVWIDLDA